MLAKWFIPSAFFAATIALVPSAWATVQWYEVSTDSCTKTAAGNGTAPWCLGKTPNGSGQYQAFYWDPSTSAWQATGKYGTQIGLMNVSSTQNYPLMLTSTGGGSDNIIWATPAGTDIGGTTTFTWGNIAGCGTSISGASVLYGGVLGGNPDKQTFVTGCTADILNDYVPYRSSYRGGSWSCGRFDRLRKRLGLGCRQRL